MRWRKVTASSSCGLWREGRRQEGVLQYWEHTPPPLHYSPPSQFAPAAARQAVPRCASRTVAEANCHSPRGATRVGRERRRNSESVHAEIICRTSAPSSLVVSSMFMASIPRRMRCARMDKPDAFFWKRVNSLSPFTPRGWANELGYSALPYCPAQCFVRNSMIIFSFSCVINCGPPWPAPSSTSSVTSAPTDFSLSFKRWL